MKTNQTPKSKPETVAQQEASSDRCAPPCSPSSTPRSDADSEYIHDRGMTEWVPLETARALELDLSAANAEAAKYIQLWDRATKDLETLKFGPENADVMASLPRASAETPTK